MNCQYCGQSLMIVVVIDLRVEGTSLKFMAYCANCQESTNPRESADAAFNAYLAGVTREMLPEPDGYHP